MRVAIPHPTRVIFPEAAITREQMVAYYEAMSQWILPRWRNRAITLVRWPHGLQGPHFYQRHDPRLDPAQPIAIDSAEDLVYWAARGAIEFHVPLGQRDAPRLHDWAVIDLDPDPPASWAQVAEAAAILLRLFDQLKVAVYLKTSGKRGLHLFVAIAPTPAEAVTRALGELATAVAQRFSRLLTVERSVVRRQGRVYLDYLQNAGTRTMAGVFSLRATSRATVSTPIGRHELGKDPQFWTLSTVLAQASERAGYFPARPEPVNLLAKLNGALGGRPVGGR
ncbi:MAG: DNA primase [Firmicutes bacterium]|nr:DNA primase [Bacillota bacterium]